MSEDDFNQDAWLERIGYRGARAPVLETLRGVIAAHSSAISYESIDVLLDRPPKLDLASLQRKMIASRRGGYCFEQNILFRGGLRSLGFDVTGLQARVVRGLAFDAPRPMLHMVLQVNLPEGPFLADVGFGNLAPTAPLALSPDLEQDTPHEIMRFIRMGDELTLQSRLGDRWEHVYRVVPLPRVDAEYEICNWFTASHPDSPHRSNLIAARPGPGRTRTSCSTRGSMCGMRPARLSGELSTTRLNIATFLPRRLGLRSRTPTLPPRLRPSRRRARAGRRIRFSLEVRGRYRASLACA